MSFLKKTSATQKR